jgi:hypothetical protein
MNFSSFFAVITLITAVIHGINGDEEADLRWATCSLQDPDLYASMNLAQECLRTAKKFGDKVTI